MKKLHQEILVELKKYAGKATKYQQDRHVSYMGTKKFSYLISNPVKRKIVKTLLKSHRDLVPQEYLKLLDSLYRGTSHEELSCAGMILEYTPKLRKNIKPEFLDRLLDNVEGWAEVDGLCQSNFTADELLASWNIWSKFLIKLSQNKNVHKRRASLVFLTKSVRESPDKRLANLAFVNIERLKLEKDILITKAVSWLLRSLIAYHKQAVADYLEKNKNSLPKIAIRETRNKLLTGIK